MHDPRTTLVLLFCCSEAVPGLLPIIVVKLRCSIRFPNKVIRFHVFYEIIISGDLQVRLKVNQIRNCFPLLRKTS